VLGGGEQVGFGKGDPWFWAPPVPYLVDVGIADAFLVPPPFDAAARLRAASAAPGIRAVWIPTFLAAVLGSWGLTRNDSMWRDESVTYQVAQRSLTRIHQLTEHVDAVHGLYYALMRLWFTVVPDGLIALRLPSLIAFCVTTALVADIGKVLWDSRAGMLAGLAYALLPVPQFYAQEGRSYALVAMMVALSCRLLLRGVVRGGHQWCIPYTVTVVAAIWLNEMAILVLLAHGCYVVFGRFGRALRRPWLCSIVVVCPAIAPLIIISKGQQESQLAWVQEPGLGTWLTFAGLALFAAATAAVVARWNPPTVTGGAGFALGVFVLPQAALLGTTLAGEHLYVERYVAYAYLGLALLLGPLGSLFLHRVMRLGAVRRTAAVTCVALVVMAFLIPTAIKLRSPDSRKDDAIAVQRAMIRLVGRDYMGARVFVPARRREWLTTQPALLCGLSDIALKRDGAAHGTLDGEEYGPRQIARTMLDNQLDPFQDEMLLIGDPPNALTHLSAADAMKLRVLRQHFRLVRSVEVHGGQVSLYVRTH
jgi:mannosyltransferase